MLAPSRKRTALLISSGRRTTELHSVVSIDQDKRDGGDAGVINAGHREGGGGQGGRGRKQKRRQDITKKNRGRVGK